MDTTINVRKFSLSKRLRGSSRFYVFDSNINQLLRVDNLTYTLFPYQQPPGYALKKLKKKYNRKEISDRLASLKDLYDKGLFRSRGHVELPFTKEGFRKNAGQKIDSFTLGITEKCNQRCKYCIFSEKSRGYRSHSEKEMDFETAQKTVDFILRSKADSIKIGFYGGEPLLKLDLVKKIIEYANRRKRDSLSLRFMITTNGTLLNKNTVDYLVKNNVQLNVSLDGPAEIHDRNRVFENQTGTFHTVIENLKYIKDKYPRFFTGIKLVAVIAPPYDYEKLENFFSRDKGLFEQNKMIITDLKREGNDFFKEPEQRYFTDDKIHAKLRNYRSRLQKQLASPGFSPTIFQEVFLKNIFAPFAANLKEGPSPGYPRYCKPGVSKLYITCDGKLHICENIPSSLPLGDIDTGLSADACYEIFHDYMETVGKRCLNCWAFSFCHLCLKYFFDHVNKRFIDKQDALAKCKHMKKSIKRNFETFLDIVSKNPDAFNLFL